MDTALLEKLICIQCNKPSLQERQDRLICSICGRNISLRAGIPDFLSGSCIGKLSWVETGSSADSYELSISQFKPYYFKRIDGPILEYVQGDVLEIGCGTCRLGTPVEKRGARYFGLDPVFSFLFYGYKHRGLQRLVLGQGERLPFQNNSFDCIISGFYAYRYVNPDLGLPEARRVLKKGGKFVFDLLNHWILKLMEFKRIIKKEGLSNFFPFRLQPPLNLFEFTSLSQLKQKAEKSEFLVEKVISTPVMPFLPALNKYLVNFYYSGKKTVYLGYNIIVILKAV